MFVDFLILDKPQTSPSTFSSDLKTHADVPRDTTGPSVRLSVHPSICIWTDSYMMLICFHALDHRFDSFSNFSKTPVYRKPVQLSDLTTCITTVHFEQERGQGREQELEQGLEQEQRQGQGQGHTCSYMRPTHQARVNLH